MGRVGGGVTIAPDSCPKQRRPSDASVPVFRPLLKRDRSRESRVREVSDCASEDSEHCQPTEILEVMALGSAKRGSGVRRVISPAEMS